MYGLRTLVIQYHKKQIKQEMGMGLAIKASLSEQHLPQELV